MTAYHTSFHLLYRRRCTRWRRLTRRATPPRSSLPLAASTPWCGAAPWDFCIAIGYHTFGINCMLLTGSIVFSAGVSSKMMRCPPGAAAGRGGGGAGQRQVPRVGARTYGAALPPGGALPHCCRAAAAGAPGAGAWELHDEHLVALYLHGMLALCSSEARNTSCDIVLPALLQELPVFVRLLTTLGDPLTLSLGVPQPLEHCCARTCFGDAEDVKGDAEKIRHSLDVNLLSD